jgi:hypothetical protein
MPILTEKYANSRWGFLDGLGAAAPAAAPAVPSLLADPKTGQFSNERFESLKKVLIDAMTRAWADYKQTWDAANKAGGFWKASTEKEASARLKASLVQNTLPRLNRFQSDLNKMFNVKDPIWNSPDNYKRFLGAIEQEIIRFQDDADTLKVAADMSFYKALQERAGVIVDNLYKAGAGIIGPGVWLAQNLPWILGVGAVLLIAGPTIAGAVKGGRSGAADAFASDVRSARGAIASGAKRAGSLMNGVPKSRRSRRRRR